MNTEIEFVKGDITRVNCDVIVNAANRTLLGGGGVDGAIHRAAGPDLLVECMKLGGCDTGYAKITSGYNLPARYIIHAVGPVWAGGGHNEEELLASCYRESLSIAKAHKLRVIAFPSISTGAYHFPLSLAAPIALKTALYFIKENEAAFDKIIFVLFSEHDFEIYKAVYAKLNEKTN
ncbi:MAG: O-acetyl-ADP-ribose deacetylase [Candidatus Omnitrophica bacterium CG11_big_fil_rev_8_21_14_0_20_42_13]|uniref:O-acetyl-ADP-ribose deacetylase n=1 Tax=Candidatus Ghiorseimicrobium undicola TaxID=1974746 RepID=A0A2H0LXA0_9BACT|nr:MAG: O-acetyl-ADP-ribose deacetylase [Candidatus Omnitrophica bacterium CG11_big_fil_rev_8_21_14_0_20_42_13]